MVTAFALLSHAKNLREQLLLQVEGGFSAVEDGHVAMHGFRHAARGAARLDRQSVGSRRESFPEFASPPLRSSHHTWRPHHHVSVRGLEHQEDEQTTVAHRPQLAVVEAHVERLQVVRRELASLELVEQLENGLLILEVQTRVNRVVCEAELKHWKARIDFPMCCRGSAEKYSA